MNPFNGARRLADRAALLTGRDVTLGNLMDRLAVIHGDRVMVEEAGEGGGSGQGVKRTFEDAGRRVAEFAGWISSVTEPGDRIVLALPNCYDLVLACLAACRAGAVPVPLNAELTEAEVELVATDSGAVRVVREADEMTGGPASTAPAAVPSQSDVAAIFYTSGTTGRPKGARLTHRALLGQMRGGALYPAAIRHDEIVFGLPLSHIMGFIAVLGAAVAGLQVYFLPRFRPVDALDAIESRRATMFIGVPAMYRLMLEAGAERRDLRCVRVWASGADAMPAELAHRFRRMGASVTLPLIGRSVGEAVFVEGYGMVETGGGVMFKAALPFVPLPGGGELGVPIPPNRLRVVDENGRDVTPGQTGELWVKGPGVLDGYHGDPEATAAAVTEDGWLRTGDMARRGAFGLVQLAGREKDVIKRGGYSVYAVEVEGALEEHPGVAEAAVVGLPDDRLGQIPVAAIRRAPGAGVTTAELEAWARQRLAAYKVPARFEFVDELPRTGTSKVRRDAVKALLGGA